VINFLKYVDFLNRTTPKKDPYQKRFRVGSTKSGQQIYAFGKCHYDLSYDPTEHNNKYHSKG